MSIVIDVEYCFLEIYFFTLFDHLQNKSLGKFFMYEIFFLLDSIRHYLELSTTQVHWEFCYFKCEHNYN